MFKNITNISDVAPFVADKKEIVFSKHSNGCIIGCYQFMDSHTFDAPESIECRGIAFDSQGNIISRPLHKFFNVGEKVHTMIENIKQENVAEIFEKIDGSMIATAWLNNTLLLRSKKSFTSDVVILAQKMLSEKENENIKLFATEVASSNMTAIFELTHPEARIVVESKTPQLRLLHVRDNFSGNYVMLDPAHPIHHLIKKYNISVGKKFDMTLNEAVESLENMTGQEGYVYQFLNGDMAKDKSDWYKRLHRSVTFLRERDIARASLYEELDDIKNCLREVGIDLNLVEEVETRLKNILLDIYNEVETIYQNQKSLDRKSFAIQYKNHPYFALLMGKYSGKEISVNEWYEKNRLKEDFGLRVLADATRAEEFNMPIQKIKTKSLTP